jgi:hypothetical protein
MVFPKLMIAPSNLTRQARIDADGPRNGLLALQYDHHPFEDRKARVMLVETLDYPTPKTCCSARVWRWRLGDMLNRFDDVGDTPTSGHDRRRRRLPSLTHSSLELCNSRNFDKTKRVLMQEPLTFRCRN